MDFWDFFREHLWAPILAVISWLLNNLHKSIETRFAIMSKKIERIERDYAKKEDLKSLLDLVREDMRYIRDRVDEIADRRARD